MYTLTNLKKEPSIHSSNTAVQTLLHMMLGMVCSMAEDVVRQLVLLAARSLARRQDDQRGLHMLYVQPPASTPHLVKPKKALKPLKQKRLNQEIRNLYAQHPNEVESYRTLNPKP